MPMPTPPEYPALFNDYLLHFCGQNKSADEAQAVLEAILRRREFIPSRCPLFFDPEGRLAKCGRQSWADMVCFTDLRFQDLLVHVKKFGPFAIALRKESGPAGACSPVHYVDAGSAALQAGQFLDAGIRRLRDLQREGKLDGAWDFPQKLAEFDRRRVAAMQDIKTRDENEWRYIPPADGEALRFEAEDVSFLLVDTWGQAVEWNRRLNDESDADLHEYGRAGVMAIPVELLLGRHRHKHGV
jgi:hypothetical protein